MTRIVAISDTHGRNPTNLPDGDILIHAGDFTNIGSPRELSEFNQWLKEQPHTYKVVVPGNHDILLEKDIQLSNSLLSSADFILRDNDVVIDGINIYGSPFTPRFGKWAFMYDGRRWDYYIVKKYDIVVTHGPPRNILDSNGREPCGCQNLADVLADQKTRPRHHIFGHIHESAGDIVIDGVGYHNVAQAHRRRGPLVLDL